MMTRKGTGHQETAAFGHHHVKDDQIGVFSFAEHQALIAVAGNQDVKSLGLQGPIAWIRRFHDRRRPGESAWMRPPFAWQALAVRLRSEICYDDLEDAFAPADFDFAVSVM